MKIIIGPGLREIADSPTRIEMCINECCECDGRDVGVQTDRPSFFTVLSSRIHLLAKMNLWPPNRCSRHFLGHFQERHRGTKPKSSTVRASTDATQGDIRLHAHFPISECPVHGLLNVTFLSVACLCKRPPVWSSVLAGTTKHERM